MSHHDMVDSMLGESMAYVEQGLMCLEDNDRKNAATMLKAAEDLIKEAEKLEDTKRSELYPHATDALNNLRNQYNNIESVQLKKTTPLGTSPTKLQNGHKTLDAELIYWLPEGVQLVMIENDKTASPSPPTSLAIFEVEQPKKSDELYPNLDEFTPKALIQVGPWVYPLNRETTPVLKNDMGVYVVPNPTTDHPDMYVGIILPRDIEKRLEDEFLQVLERYATVRQSSIVEGMSPDERSKTSERIATFLLKSGQKIAMEIKNVADKSGAFVAEKGEKYRSNKVPTDKPVNINPALRYGVLTVYKGSKAFAKVTRFVLDKVGDVGVNIGNRIAKSMSGPSGGGRLIGSSATVIGGGIGGASLVWIALEDASKQLFHSLSNETVQTVKIHYGDQASETTRQALHGAGHTTLSAFQLYDLGPRSIAGRVARKAGIQFVTGMSRKDSSSLMSKNTEKKALE